MSSYFKKSGIEKRIQKEIARERLSTALYAIGIILCVGLIALILVRIM